MMFILFYQIILQTILNMAAAISTSCACVYTTSCSPPTGGRRNSRLNSRISGDTPLVMAKVFGGVRVVVISCSARGSCGVRRFLRWPGAIGPTAHFSKMIWLFAALTAIRTTICTSLLDMENHSLASFRNFRRLSENPTSITIVGKSSGLGRTFTLTMDQSGSLLGVPQGAVHFPAPICWRSIRGSGWMISPRLSLPQQMQ